MKKITSFTHHLTAEGDRISFTFSELDADGNLTSQNNRKNFVVTDDGLKAHIDAINAYIKENKLGGD